MWQKPKLLYFDQIWEALPQKWTLDRVSGVPFYGLNPMEWIPMKKKVATNCDKKNEQTKCLGVLLDRQLNLKKGGLERTSIFGRGFLGKRSGDYFIFYLGAVAIFT